MGARTILDVVSELRRDDPEIQVLAADAPVEPGKHTEFELVDWNGKPRFVPSEALVTSRLDWTQVTGFLGSENARLDPAKGRPFMYRGQVQRHPTCMPTLFRNAPDDQWHIKALLTLERFRVAELELVLRKHPFSEVSKRHGFWVDYHALAQHYGIPTSLLDLTSDMRIAAFFAVAAWDQMEGKHVPAKDGVGVLYRFDWTALGQGCSKLFDPVGFGPGLRPSRQHAWTFRPRPLVDFQSMPLVSAHEFDHSEDASSEVFSWFENGAWLMPPDCLVSLVDKVRDLPFIIAEAIRYAARQDGQPEDQIELAVDRSMQFLNYTLRTEFVDGHRLELEDDDMAVGKRQAKELDERLHKISKGFRLIRTAS